MNRVRDLKKDRDPVSGERERIGRKVRLSFRNQRNNLKKLGSNALERLKNKALRGSLLFVRK